MDKIKLEILNRNLQRAVFERKTLNREFHDNFYWHSRRNVFELLEVRRYNCIHQFYDFYGIYTERYYTRQEILECTYQANRIASFLCLLREPEREIIILFNEMYDYIMHNVAPQDKDETKEYLTGCLYDKYINTVGKDYIPKPTAKMLDGVFSMTYYMLKVQPVKSTKIELVLRMIERQLYPYINTLPDEHRFLREGYGVLYANQTLGEDTLLDAIKDYIKENGEERNVPDLKNVNSFIGDIDSDITYSYFLDDVRILTSLCPSAEEQGWALSVITRGIRETFTKYMMAERADEDEIMKMVFDIVRWYSTEDFDKLLPIKMNNYDDSVKSLAKCLEIPREWGYDDSIIIEERDSDGNVIFVDDDYNMEQKMEPIFFGLTDNTQVNEDKEMKEQMRQEDILTKARQFKITVSYNSNERVSDETLIKIHDFIESVYMNEERESGVSMALYLFLININIILSQSDFPRLMKSWFAEFKGTQSSISNYSYLIHSKKEDWWGDTSQENMFTKICTTYDYLITQWRD